MIPLINKIGQIWFEYFGLAVLQNTLFLGCIFLAFYILKNADARIKFALGVLGLAKLLLPPFLPASFSFFSTSAPAGSIMIGDFQSGQVVTTSSAPIITLAGVFFALWLITAIIYILIAVVSTLVMKSRLSSAIKQPGANLHKIALFQSDKISVPMSMGLFPKKIYLPAYWPELPPEGQKVLLQHELAHIQRRDGLAHLLQTIVQALYFFHPFVWLLNERINEYREMACDDKAIQDVQLSPGDYSRYLVQVAEKIVEPQWSYASVSALVKQKNKLLNRVTYQLQEADMKQLAKHKTTVVFITLFALMLPLSWYSMAEKVGENVQIIIAEANNPQDVGEIFGEISDAKTGKFIMSARVSLPGTEMVVATHDKGQFFIGNIPPGVYTLEVSRDGFKNKKLENVEVSALRTSRVDVKLEPVLVSNKSRLPEDFVPFDVPPQPVGGFAQIQKNLVYPQSAINAGIQGKVYIDINFDEKGQIVDTKIAQSLNKECDQAAINAIKAVKWEPAKNDGKPVSVWITIPVVFKLHD